MTHQFDLRNFPNYIATGTPVLINKRGHTFDDYTGIVTGYRAFNGKIKHYEIRLDDGQDLKGGNGLTFAAPKSLIKLQWDSDDYGDGDNGGNYRNVEVR